MKEYVWAVWFEGLFIFNLHVWERSRELAHVDAQKQIERRYPVKWRQIVLKAPYEPYIPPHEEPKGQMIKMIPT